MIDIAGWIVWALLAFLAIGWAIGARTYTKAGANFHMATAVQTFFFWAIAVTFLITDWNKLHILWAAPVSFFLAQLLVIGGIPILSQIVILLTTAFMAIILIGVRPPTLPLEEPNEE